MYQYCMTLIIDILAHLTRPTLFLTPSSSQRSDDALTTGNPPSRQTGIAEWLVKVMQRERERASGDIPLSNALRRCICGARLVVPATVAQPLCAKSHWMCTGKSPFSTQTATEQYGNCAWCGVEAEVVESTCFYINLKVMPVSVAHLETIKFASHFVNWYANQFCILSTLSDRSISANDWLARYIAFLLFDDIHVAETILALGHLGIWPIL